MNDVHEMETKMFKTLSTLIAGANARGEARVRDAFAIELIDQKIRDADSSLKAAKSTLASLIQRQRAEEAQRSTLQRRLSDLTDRAKTALDEDRDDLAMQAAEAIAQMENELAVRTETLQRLDQKVMRLRTSIEAGHRRIIDLKQGAIQARAVRKEQSIQMRMSSTNGASSVQEAEELIARVLDRDDPFERTEILSEINDDLNNTGLIDRMADAGLGDPTRSNAKDVLARLKAKKS
jgi:phage shock protein A